RRGLIMGIWNAHTSVGNMLGSVIAGAFVETNWGLSFIVPGIIIGAMGILVFLFLVPRELSPPVSSPLCYVLPKILKVIKIPLPPPYIFLFQGVAEFAFCLFFAKLVSYTFLYWLPNYIKSEAKVSSKVAAYTSTIFDAGGIVGGILAGYVSDKYHMRGVTCVIFLILAAPMVPLKNDLHYYYYYYLPPVLLAVCGLAVNGPYALITTAVSADLGTHKTVRDNAKALGMVTAIIDGTGSIGAALGPLLTGLITSKSSWGNVFYMLIAADIMAALLLVRVVVREIREKLAGAEDDVTIIVPKLRGGKHQDIDDF
ncbi:hypothetical protein EGW08_018452, partial [Elysia chlorotica]